jgi:hypothetical protein
VIADTHIQLKALAAARFVIAQDLFSSCEPCYKSKISGGVQVVRRTPNDVSSFLQNTGIKKAFIQSRLAPQENSKTAILAEHSRVKAIQEICDGDDTVPVGAMGTVVHVIKGGVGYDVEFTTPKHVIVSAGRDELSLA